MNWLNWLLAVLSGILLVLTFPQSSISYSLAPCALTPLIVAAAREPRRVCKRFALGYLTGLIYWCGVNSWIQFVLDVHGGTGPALGWVLFGLFCLAKSLAHGRLCAARRMGRAGALGRAGGSGAVGRHRMDTRATGLRVARSRQCGNRHGRPAASGAGYGRIWTVVPVRHDGDRADAADSAAPATADCSAAAHPGAVRPARRCPKPLRGKASAVLVQPNIPDDQVWNPATFEATMQQLELLSIIARAQRTPEQPDLLVWPEVPAPFYRKDARNGRGRAAHRAKQMDLFSRSA